MTEIRGCNLPEDLYYLIDKHVWARPMEDGVVRVGMTSVAAKLSGGKLAAVTIKTKAIGQELAQGKSVATVESSKFVGPVPAPVTGVLVRGNDGLGWTERRFGNRNRRRSGLPEEVGSRKHFLHLAGYWKAGVLPCLPLKHLL